MERLDERLDETFTHFDTRGNAIMVDVASKAVTLREARAKGWIRITPATLAAIQQGTTYKGDVLGVARLAGIMAAKKTADLIPLCHPLEFDSCAIDFEFLPAIPPGRDALNSAASGDGVHTAAIEACCTVRLSGKTGAEMEALTGVSVALLTIYDMCKAIDRSMVITGIALWEKSGGKSGHYVRES